MMREKSKMMKTNHKKTIARIKRAIIRKKTNNNNLITWNLNKTGNDDQTFFYHLPKYIQNIK
jgi:hypothetical protein